MEGRAGGARTGPSEGEPGPDGGRGGGSSPPSYVFAPNLILAAVKGMMPVTFNLHTQNLSSINQV